MRSRPSFAYDPIGPIRDPRTKRSVAETTQEMAAVMALIAQNADDGTVTKDDLHRAGFSNGEIDRCHAEAVLLTNQRLRPRQLDPAHRDAA